MYTLYIHLSLSLSLCICIYTYIYIYVSVYDDAHRTVQAHAYVKSAMDSEQITLWELVAAVAAA